MRSLLFLFFLLAHVCPATSQDIQFEEPMKMGAAINSDAEEINPLLSPDGKKIYFVRAFDPENLGGKISGSDIWVSEKNSAGEWQKASNKTYPWNTKGSNAVIGINKNNDVIYLLNAYKNKSGIAFSKLLNGKWTAPEIISIPGMEKSEFVGYYMNPSFNTLLISMNTRDSFGQEDLYISVKDSLGNWSAPINLGSTINTDGFEIAPFLSDDGKKLYFSSNGHKGLGDADIFVAERPYESWTVWSKPRNLGSPVNSEKFDSYFTLYNDSICYFSSNRNSDFSDIYQSRIKQKAVFKDSVNQIIKETQQLLSGLKTDATEAVAKKEKVEFIPFDINSVLPSKAAKEQIDLLLSQYNFNRMRTIEIMAYSGDTSNPSVNYNLSLSRSKNVIDYIVSRGVNSQKLKTKTSNDRSTKGKNGIEIKIYFQ